MDVAEKKFQFTWRIEGFNSNLPNIGNEIMDSICFASPNFKVYIFGYTKWYLELYPKSGRNGDFLKCLPICMDYSKDYSVSCELSILGKNDSVHASKKTKCRCSTVFHCDFSNAIEFERCKLPQQNNLVFRCILSFEDESGEIETATNDYEELSQDLLNLYKGQVLTDLTLCVGTTKLPAHRTIVCIRAPKFAEELCIQDDGNSHPVVNVSGISLPVLKILLSYIYSGRIDESVDSMLPELCKAAKKYQLDHLKSELLPVITHSTAHTKVKTCKESFIWPMSNFTTFEEPVVKLLDLEIGHFVATFSTKSPDSFQISFKIVSFPGNKHVYLRCKISVLDEAGDFRLPSDHMHCFQSVDITKKQGMVWDFPTLLKKSDLMPYKHQQNDTLKLHLQLESTEGDKISEIVYVQESLKDHSPKIAHLKHLSSDLYDIFKVRNRPGVGGDYYEGDCYNDIVLNVVDEVVGCHKAILCARSPAFAKMIEHNSKNEEISISDMDHNTLLLMVQYMYSGQITNVAATEATRLYAAAEKYKMTSLSKKCISLLEKSLSVQSVCDVIALCVELDQYPSEILDCIKEYSDRNLKVFESNEWKELLQSKTPSDRKKIHEIYLKVFPD